MDTNEPAPEVVEEGAPLPAGHVALPRADFEKLRALAEAAGGRDESRRLLQADAARDREARLERELATRDERVAALERSCRSAVRDRELATMLAGRPLVPGAAAQLIKLWRDEFDVYEEEGGYKVATRDGRPPSQAVGDWLSSGEYAHFCLPASRGGTGARDSNRPASPAAQQEGPKNLGEAVVMKWREETASRPNDPAKPIGLKRHR